MIRIKIFVFNPFQENTFVLSDETGECVIIDPGCNNQNEKDSLREYITSNGLTCKKLINTHGHVDHVLGNAFVAEAYHPEMLIHKDDAFLLDEAPEHGRIFGFDVEMPPQPTAFAEEGQTIPFGNSELHILHVPGHSPGSIALYCKEQNFVIAGDVLFKGSIGRTDLAGGDYDQIMKSIFSKLMTLPQDTIVYPGHGPSTTIHEEALSNPFLG